MALLKSHEVVSFVVGFAVDPATMKDTDPFEGESTKRSLMGATAFAVALVEGPSPEGARDGLAHPLDEGLALEGGAREAPVHPTLVATALGDRRDPHVLLEGSSVGESLASLTEGNEEARSQCGTCTRERVEELVVGKLGAERGDLGIEAFDGDIHCAELRNGGLDEQQQRLDNSGVGGQRFFGMNGIEASSDSALASHVMTSEEADERVLTSAFGGIESRPALEERGKDGGVLVAEPVEDLRKVSF